MKHDEFYVGYLPTMPPATARQIRRTVAGLGAIALCAGTAIVLSQGQFAQSAFDFGQSIAYQGTLEAQPYPSLIISRPGAMGTAFSRYFLVAPGKHGLEVAPSVLGKTVRIAGAPIYRGPHTMLEVASTITIVDASSPALPGWTHVSQVEVTGEIVDSKCYLGVMNPGNGKVHRDCAARCISGGVPPMFIGRTAEGNPVTALLAGSDREPIGSRILNRVAEPVRIRGTVFRSGDSLLLATPVDSIVSLQ